MRTGPHPPTLRVEGPVEGDFRWRIVIGEGRDPDRLDELIAEGLDQIESAANRSGPIQLWIRGARDHDDQVAAEHGFVRYREVWQLRCPLPAAAPTIETRPFEPSDLPALVELNNRAFHWHPEQGGRTIADVATTMREGWFDPEGLRLHHIDDRLAGFCWTKIHTDHEPPLGEIFVIAVDPDLHGRGLGVPMTLAGLDWLAARGLTEAMLYVESDNVAANATYARIGFERHHVDRAYRRPSP